MVTPESIEQLLAGLNPSQREAAEHLHGPVLILAGAGSGKTRTLVYRLVNLMHHDVAPFNIMAVTFTNKAAQEMKRRVEDLLGRRAAGLTLGTFHSICVRILRREADKIGHDANFTIYDEDDQSVLIREILKELDLDPARHHPRGIRSRISSAKNKNIDLAKQPARSYAEEIDKRVYLEYQKKLRSNHGFDFDDLLLETVKLFEDHPDIRLQYEDQYKHILVDEYQDVNRSQYRLVKLLGENHRNLCAVGDDDQSIYSFRGADVELILSFEKDFPEAKVIRLEQNYRSTGNILSAANAISKNNRKRKTKKLWTENIEGEKLAVFEALNEREEARKVRDEIARLSRDDGRALKDFAILYRTNAQSRAVEETFLQSGIPYHLVGGVRFYDRREIKDMLAYLKALVNPFDSISLKRIINAPSRGIGNTTLKHLADFSAAKNEGLFYALTHLDEISGIKEKAKKTLERFKSLLAELLEIKKTYSLTHLVKQVFDLSGYSRALEDEGDAEAASRIENCRELWTVTYEFENAAEDHSLEAFLYHVSLLSDVDGLKEGAESVTMMTLHAAKGLEFPIVFMIGMEEGIFPHSRTLTENADVEEERRLCYVGVTRAREKLYLLRAEERSLYGMTNYGEPSLFLTEIPSRLCDFQSQRGSSELRGNSGAPARSGIGSWNEAGARLGLRLGDRISHGQWGKGVIIQKTGFEVTVAFEGIGLKSIAADEAAAMKNGVTPH